MLKTLTSAVDSQGVDLQAQYRSPAKYNARFNIYKYAVDERDMHEEIAQYVEQHMPLDARILDIGSGNGRMLTRLKAYKHLIGVDNTARDYPMITASAEHLPIADASQDCVLALFMLYHVTDPLAALWEFKRILKPGGTLIVATSGPNNKNLHRRLERQIATLATLPLPPEYNLPFNSLVAADLIPQVFTIREHVQQFTRMELGPKQLPAYLASLDSMAEADDATWQQAVASIAKPQLEAALREQGSISDIIDRHYYICN